MCDVAHSVLRDRVERYALADRAAGFVNRDTQEPVDVDGRVQQWEAWLAHDPAATPEVRESALIEQIMGRGAA